MINTLRSSATVGEVTVTNRWTHANWYILNPINDKRKITSLREVKYCNKSVISQFSWYLRFPCHVRACHWKKWSSIFRGSLKKATSTTERLSVNCVRGPSWSALLTPAQPLSQQLCMVARMIRPICEKELKQKGKTKCPRPTAVTENLFTQWGNSSLCGPNCKMWTAPPNNKTFLVLGRKSWSLGTEHSTQATQLSELQ